MSHTETETSAGARHLRGNDCSERRPDEPSFSLGCDAASGHFDAHALGFWERYGRRTLDRLALPAAGWCPRPRRVLRHRLVDAREVRAIETNVIYTTTRK
jgi:hypothetical protein